MMDESKLTRYLLQFCYTCLDAYRCETETKCRECFNESGMLTDAEEMTTEELLRQYAY